MNTGSGSRRIRRAYDHRRRERKDLPPSIRRARRVIEKRAEPGSKSIFRRQRWNRQPRAIRELLRASRQNRDTSGNARPIGPERLHDDCFETTWNPGAASKASNVERTSARTRGLGVMKQSTTRKGLQVTPPNTRRFAHRLLRLRPAGRHARTSRATCRTSSDRRFRARDPEVRELHLAIEADEDVVRRHVAMDDRELCPSAAARVFAY